MKLPPGTWTMPGGGLISPGFDGCTVCGCDCVEADKSLELVLVNDQTTITPTIVTTRTAVAINKIRLVPVAFDFVSSFPATAPPSSRLVISFSGGGAGIVRIAGF